MNFNLEINFTKDGLPKEGFDCIFCFQNYDEVDEENEDYLHGYIHNGKLFNFQTNEECLYVSLSDLVCWYYVPSLEEIINEKK